MRGSLNGMRLCTARIECFCRPEELATTVLREKNDFIRKHLKAQMFPAGNVFADVQLSLFEPARVEITLRGFFLPLSEIQFVLNVLKGGRHGSA